MHQQLSPADNDSAIYNFGLLNSDNKIIIFHLI